MPEVTILRMYRTEGDMSTKAFCDIMINETVIIKGIRVMEGKSGLFVKLPNKQGKDGRWYNLVSPASKEIMEYLNELILGAFAA